MNGPKDHWPSVLSLSGARVVCWRTNALARNNMECPTSGILWTNFHAHWMVIQCTILLIKRKLGVPRDPVFYRPAGPASRGDIEIRVIDDNNDIGLLFCLRCVLEKSVFIYS